MFIDYRVACYAKRSFSVGCSQQSEKSAAHFLQSVVPAHGCVDAEKGLPYSQILHLHTKRLMSASIIVSLLGSSRQIAAIDRKGGVFLSSNKGKRNKKLDCLWQSA